MYRGATPIDASSEASARLRCKGRAPAAHRRPLPGGSQRRAAVSHRPTALFTRWALPCPFLAVCAYYSVNRAEMQDGMRRKMDFSTWRAPFPRHAGVQPRLTRCIPRFSRAIRSRAAKEEGREPSAALE